MKTTFQLINWNVKADKQWSYKDKIQEGQRSRDNRQNTSIEIFPQNFEFSRSADTNQNQENELLKEQRERKLRQNFKKLGSEISNFKSNFSSIICKEIGVKSKTFSAHLVSEPAI